MRSLRVVVAALALTMTAACASGGPTPVTLATLAAQQDQYDGRTVTTDGVVTEVRDAPAEEPYYVLQDEFDNRVRLLPSDAADSYANEHVSVVGEFRFVADRGRELRIGEIRRGRR